MQGIVDIMVNKTQVKSLISQRRTPRPRKEDGFSEVCSELVMLLDTS